MCRCLLEKDTEFFCAATRVEIIILYITNLNGTGLYIYKKYREKAPRLYLGDESRSREGEGRVGTQNLKQQKTMIVWLP